MRLLLNVTSFYCTQNSVKRKKAMRIVPPKRIWQFMKIAQNFSKPPKTDNRASVCPRHATIGRSPKPAVARSLPADNRVVLQREVRGFMLSAISARNAFYPARCRAEGKSRLGIYRPSSIKNAYWQTANFRRATRTLSRKSSGYLPQNPGCETSPPPQPPLTGRHRRRRHHHGFPRQESQDQMPALTSQVLVDFFANGCFYVLHLSQKLVRPER